MQRNVIAMSSVSGMQIYFYMSIQNVYGIKEREIHADNLW